MGHIAHPPFPFAPISIHPPRVGWDFREPRRPSRNSPISIHPPRVGWDILSSLAEIPLFVFQSTHPVWGGTSGVGSDFETFPSISIHPPRVGWDPTILRCPAAIMISIHPPRVGWDWRHREGRSEWAEFQSTHPVWGGTGFLSYSTVSALISIHPPRVGWDSTDCFGAAFCCISIHPPRVGWDSVPLSHARTQPHFNPPTPCGVGRHDLTLF